MSILQLLLTLVVPFFMWRSGRTLRNGNVPYKKKKGVRYSTKRAKASEEAWTFANDLYFNMLRMSGINLGLISIVLFIIVVFKAEELLWTLVIVLLAVQLVAGWILPGLFTELFLRKSFDGQGKLIAEEDTEDMEEAEESAGIVETAEKTEGAEETSQVKTGETEEIEEQSAVRQSAVREEEAETEEGPDQEE